MSAEEVERLTDAQVGDLHALYQGEWWTKQRALADLPVMLRRTDHVFGVREPESGRLIAFARVLTDGVFKAFVFDVIVAREFRGRALGARLVGRILHHPDLRAVRQIELACLPELAPFYRRFGFSEDVGGLMLMRREATTHPGG